MNEFCQALELNGYPAQNPKFNDFINSLRLVEQRINMNPPSTLQILRRSEAAMYLSILLHQSNGLRATEESHNDVSVDAYRNYTARGYIQLTGEANYRAASLAFGHGQLNYINLYLKDFEQ